MAFTLASFSSNLNAVLQDVAGQGGLLDNLVADINAGSDPTGISDSIADSSTLLGNIAGNSGVLQDLFSSSGQTSQILADVAGNGGIVNNLVTDNDPLGTEYLLNGSTVLGNVAGNSGLVDDALTLVFFG
jgi:hypothetical protein